ncbi:hypothetical protein TIFTF001_027490 [Ficus carica]|uniref:Uncharacterized protein n=1 Tax=Ficus carica TaxID=3494 RepID=A0AA88DNA1_FICCA|nr:hypothetical protein TIFTF001_027490 [Ficus carica]
MATMSETERNKPNAMTSLAILASRARDLVCNLSGEFRI